MTTLTLSKQPLIQAQEFTLPKPDLDRNDQHNLKRGREPPKRLPFDTVVSYLASLTK